MKFLRTFRAIFQKIAKYKKAPGPSTGSGTFGVTMYVDLRHSRVRMTKIAKLFCADAESSERYVPDLVLVVDDDGNAGEEVRPV